MVCLAMETTLLSVPAHLPCAAEEERSSYSVVTSNANYKMS